MPSRNDEYSKMLDSVIETTGSLVDSVHEIDISYAELKVELKNSIDQVKDLMKSLRYSDNRINELDKNFALHEQLIHQLEAKYEELDKAAQQTSSKEIDHSHQLEVSDRNGKWNMRAAYVAGIFTMICSIVAIILSLRK